jgi:hypothetical protein
VAQLDVSRAIRADLATRISDGRMMGLSFSVPDDIVVRLDDVDGARLIVRQMLGTLLDGTESGLLSVTQPDVTTVVLSLR